MLSNDLKHDQDAKKGLILALILVVVTGLTIALSQPAGNHTGSALPGSSNPASQ